MKAKFLTIIALTAAGVFSSCNMDLAPIGSLNEETAIEKVSDVKSYRNFFYTAIRGLACSDFFVYSDIQTDCFNGLVINGNRMGTIANGTILASDSDIAGYWASLYYYINNANLLLEKAEPIYQKALDENNVAAAQELERYIGETHFFRGYFYALMFDRWCQQYSPERGDTPALGLPIVTKYAPTADRSKYPGRNTMNETLKLIKEDLEYALNAMRDWEEIDNQQLEPMAIYLSSYAVEAMQARLALWIGDYDTAIAKAQSVIGSKIYKLSTYDNFGKLWSDDQSNEIIFLGYEDRTELSGSIGSNWIGTLSNQADYIPSSDLISKLSEGYSTLMKGSGDVRYLTYVKTRDLSTNYGNIGTPCFEKFPGNEALMVTTTPNLQNMPKIFRLAEQYLILAEAAYNKGDEATANQALQTLKKNRYIYRGGEPTYDDLSGTPLLREIQLQRTLELVGEGFRLSDLRRWKMGFTRTSDYANIKYTGLTGVKKDQINSILTPAGLQVIYTTDDHRYTWPIPTDEMDVNPQIRGQQNPGYSH